MIDLDMKEIVDAVGLGTTAGLAEAIRVYKEGGGGLCTAADVADTTILQCTATTDVKGNSVKGSGAIRTIQGFATSGEAKMTKWTTYPVYKAYWQYVLHEFEDAIADCTAGDVAANDDSVHA